MGEVQTRLRPVDEEHKPPRHKGTLQDQINEIADAHAETEQVHDASEAYLKNELANIKTAFAVVGAAMTWASECLSAGELADVTEVCVHVTCEHRSSAPGQQPA